MKARIAVLGGDGIGPEVAAQGAAVLRAVAARGGHQFELTEALVGGAAIDATGQPLPAETLALCRASDAILFGAIGGPRWGPSAPVRPEQGLLALRRELGLFANLRPVTVNPRLASASPLKAELLVGVDLLVVRELTGGIYFGEKTRTATSASDLCSLHGGGDRAGGPGGRPRWRGGAARRSPASTRPTCSRPRASGARWPSGSSRPSSPTASSSTSWSTAAPCSWCGAPPTSTWSSPRTCSATSSPTRPRCWPAPSACCPRPRWARAAAGSTSPSTARRPTSPARASPTPTAPS